jgi:hypothetical protein
LPLAPIAAAHATVLGTQTESFPASGPILTFQRYAGAGALTDVKIDFSISIVMFGYYTNYYTLPVTATVIEGVSGSYAVQSGAPAVLLAEDSYSPGFANASETFSDLPSGATRFSAVDSASNSSSTIISDPVDLTEFNGSGDFSFLEEFYQYQIIDYNPALSGGVFTAGDAFTIGFLAISGAVTVTYDGVLPTVASAPEPSTWVMALLGFLGLGFASNSKLKKAFVFS